MKIKYVKTKDSFGLRSVYGSLLNFPVNGATFKCTEITFKDGTGSDKFMYNKKICYKLNNSLFDFHGNCFKIDDNSKVFKIEDGIISYKWLIPLPDEESIKNQPIQKTYLMKDSNGFTKIGKSHNPKIREHTLQSERPCITLLAISDEQVERELHDKYEIKRGRGEWFNLSDKDIEDIITQYNFRIVN